MRRMKEGGGEDVGWEKVERMAKGKKKRDEKQWGRMRKMSG